MNVPGRLQLWLGASLLATACGPPAPDVVWVPGDGFSAAVSISVDLAGYCTVRVGEELVLHATRTSGPWRQVAADSLEQGACWLVRPPTDVEQEVQASVRWVVEPEGHGTFNLPRPPDLHRRTVTFAAAGTYRLWAVGHGWCGEPVASETVEFIVVE